MSFETSFTFLYSMVKDAVICSKVLYKILSAVLVNWIGDQHSLADLRAPRLNKVLQNKNKVPQEKLCLAWDSSPTQNPFEFNQIFDS